MTPRERAQALARQLHGEEVYAETAWVAAIANEIVREGEMLYGTGEPDNRPTISVSSCPHKTSEECDCMSRENLGLTQ